MSIYLNGKALELGKTIKINQRTISYRNGIPTISWGDIHHTTFTPTTEHGRFYINQNGDIYFKNKSFNSNITCLEVR